MGNKLYEENSISAIASAIRNKLGVETTYKVSEMPGAINSIVKPTGTTNIVQNGYHDVTAYEQAYVNVPGSVPTGTKNITENGDYNVADYASAHVEVPQPVGKKTVTANGTDIDIAQYATLDVIVQPNVDEKTITTNGTYNASSDNLDGYSKVIVTTPVPTGKKTVYENGTNIDISSYALLDVAVPGPIGKKTVIANGTDIDIAQYATLDVIVPGPNLGTKSIIQNGTYNASTDNLDGYSSVTVTVPQPSGNIDITADQLSKTVNVSNYATATVVNPFCSVMSSTVTTITEDTANLVFSYDTTKHINYVIIINLDNSTAVAYNVMSAFFKRGTITDDFSYVYGTSISYNATQENGQYQTSTFGTATFDSENAQITVALVGQKRFKANSTYMIMTFYNPINA